MAEPRSDLSGLYRFTSISRPIDPAYLTNRALLVILPLLALLSAGLTLLNDMDVSAASAAFSSALAAFAAWALTRELAPDHNAAAFVALVLAWTANVILGAQMVLLLFVALILVRMVNRSTGLPLRLFDTLAVLGFCTWAAISAQQPLILLLTAAAFALDAALRNPLRRHYLAAAACLPVFAWMVLDGAAMIASDLTATDWVLVAMFACGMTLAVNRAPEPISYCDTSPTRLDRVRVNAGVIVGFLVAVQSLLTNGRSAWLETPIWGCMIAVLLSIVVRHATGRPSNVIVS